MKILACHNYYQQRGGEDESFEGEVALLRSRGVEVVLYTRHNDDIQQASRWELARETVWSRRTYDEVSALIDRHQPSVVHCTNTFPLISPAVYTAARAAGVPVLQALRNYRLMCPNGLLQRNDTVCQSCLGKIVPWPGVVRGCYRGSPTATAVVAGMLAWHRLRRTWWKDVDLFYTLTDFSRSRFVAAGFPAERIRVKPNFVAGSAGPGEGGGGYAVFVGRLSAEKGIDTLLAAWSGMSLDLPLKIVGDGPLAERVSAAAAKDSRIEWLGKQPLESVYELLREAMLLVMPSTWFETFGRTIVEAYAAGTPVVASALGAMQELVHDGRTGFTFQPGNSLELADCVRRLACEPLRRAAMREAARAEYERAYTPDRNYEMLMELYQELTTKTTRTNEPCVALSVN